MVINSVWGNVTMVIIYALIVLCFAAVTIQEGKYIRERILRGGISLAYASDILMKASIAFVFVVSLWVRTTAVTGSGQPWKSETQFWLWLIACILLLFAVVIKISARWGGEWDLYAFFSFKKGSRHFYVKRIKTKGEQS